MREDEERILRSIIRNELRNHNMAQNDFLFLTRMQQEHPDRYGEMLREEEAELAEERRAKDIFR